MRQFYVLSEKVATLSQQLSWGHYKEILKFDDINEINYYISITESYNLSVRELREKIKNKLKLKVSKKVLLFLVRWYNTIININVKIFIIFFISYS